MEASSHQSEVEKESEEAQVRTVQHIRKNLTLFEANREIYEIRSTDENRGHLQTLLSQRQTHRVHFNQRPVIDQYTQYRASDLGNYSSYVGQKSQTPSATQNVRVHNIQKRTAILPQIQSKTLQGKSHQSASSDQGQSLKRSVSLINGFLRKPLSLVRQGKRQVSESKKEEQVSSISEDGLYKVPVRSNQNFSASQSLYLLPTPEPAVHIATLKVKDIILAHNRMKQRQTSSKSSNSQKRISQFFSSDSLRRSLYLPKPTTNTRERSRSLTVPRNERSRRSPRYSSPPPANNIDHSVSKIKAKIKVPSGRSDKAIIADNKDGTIKISYEPKEVGQHEISLRYDQEPIDDSPIIFYVDAIGSGRKKITAYGAGLARGSAGELNKFTINTGGLGSAKLSVTVEGPSKTQVTLDDNKDGTITVNYLPVVAGRYKVAVSFDGTQIVGSPFMALITDQNRQRSHINLPNGSEHLLDFKIAESELKTLHAVIITPSGLEEPCDLKLLETGQLAVVFTPREQGEHRVNVKRQLEHISGSPFRFEVISRDIGDAKLVHVSGEGLCEGQTNTENEIIIDTRKAGYGGLSVALEGPGRSEISSSEATDGTIKLTYKPYEPGHYSLIVKYADHVVSGSPFSIKVSGRGTNPQKETLRKFRKAVPIANINQECHFSIKVPPVGANDLSARIHSPQGSVEDASIIEQDNHVYLVVFVPREVGLYSLSIRNNDMHIAGSPFPYTVGPLSDSGPHKVRCGGSGLIRGACGKLNEFNVFTREAGSGELSVMIEGPSKAELSYTDRQDGSCHVGYKVSEPGEYRISVVFNEQQVPDSPFRAFIMPQVGEVNKIQLAPLPPESVQLNKPCSLGVIMNGAIGDIEAEVRLPGGGVEDCDVTPTVGGDMSVTFIPRQLGIHQVHIKFNKGATHIPQSPVFIRVGRESADPASIIAHGNGLKKAIVNQATDFTLETYNAGQALLEVHIEGPSKVSMGCAEMDVGYKINYTPLVPGDYLISVKYNSCHTGASPYKVRAVKQPGTRTLADAGSHEISSIAITTTDRKEAKQTVENLPKFESNAKRVQCKGVGLGKVFAGKANLLTVDCSEAGFNMIYAAFLGSNRNSIHETSVKHICESVYEVRYTCEDKGDAILIVRYGEEHIPGSPFLIKVI